VLAVPSALVLVLVSGLLSTSWMLLRSELLGAGDAALTLPLAGLVLLELSVSGGVGIMNCVPLVLRGFLEGDVSSGADRFRFCGDAGEDTMSSMGGCV
jgi:hypothetical protein